MCWVRAHWKWSPELGQCSSLPVSFTPHLKCHLWQIKYWQTLPNLCVHWEPIRNCQQNYVTAQVYCSSLLLKFTCKFYHPHLWNCYWWQIKCLRAGHLQVYDQSRAPSSLLPESPSHLVPDKSHLQFYCQSHLQVYCQTRVTFKFTARVTFKFTARPESPSSLLPESPSSLLPDKSHLQVYCQSHLQV